MELVFYTLFTSIWWLLSISAFLPFVLLLKFNKSFRDSWFSFFFVNIVIPIFSKRMIPNRKRAFNKLKEHLKNRNKSIPLNVMEIGMGAGANFEFYPENSKLTVLDMNESFQKYLQNTKKKFPSISYQKTVISSAEDMREVDDSCMDVIICTYVLCSIIDVDKALSEVLRTLKPGGVFLFLEHVAFPKSDWRYTLQQYATPLWHLYFDGCYINRDALRSINKAGFSDIAFEKVQTNVYLFIRPQVLGIAIK